MLRVAKFKGAPSQRAYSIRQKTYVQRKAVFVIKRSGNQLTKEDTLGQKGAFLDVTEKKSEIQKSEYTEGVCSREKVHELTLKLWFRS